MTQRVYDSLDNIYGVKMVHSDGGEETCLTQAQINRIMKIILSKIDPSITRDVADGLAKEG